MASGSTSLRRRRAFEPGETKTVRLVDIAGSASSAAATTWPIGARFRREPGSRRAAGQADGFAHRRINHAAKNEPPALRRDYGPTTGDRVRLGDTSLVLEVERDFTVYGDECKFGGGKVLREGMGQAAGVGPAERSTASSPTRWSWITREFTRPTSASRTDDCRHRQGRQSRRHGRGHRGMIVGVTTEVIAGEGLMSTAGGIDTHIHFICPQQAFEAIAAGLTTMVGGGTGPATGTAAPPPARPAPYIA